MKKKLAWLLAGLMCLSFAGCGTPPAASSSGTAPSSQATAPNSVTSSKAAERNTAAFQGVTYEITSGWLSSLGEDGKSIFYYPSVFGNSMLMMTVANHVEIQDPQQKEAYIGGITADSKDYEKIEVSDTTVNGRYALKHVFNDTFQKNSNDVPMYCSTYVFDYEEGLMTVWMAIDRGLDSAEAEAQEAEFEAVIRSIRCNPAPVKAVSSAPSVPSVPSATIGERNALSKAKSYLKFSAFSETGLIGQLEFEGFSTEEALYGVENCGANWNDQAAKKAQQYLDYSSFSREGLISQLEFEGFTSEQAEYGVTAVGY